MTTFIRERIDEIAVGAIAGDEASFGSLYEAMSGSIFNLVMRSVHDRETAEDISQDVWVKAHREIATVRSSEALPSWLFRMASRACIDYSRSRACRERGNIEITEQMLEAPADEPETVLLRQSQLRSMWEALAAMPTRQSMALYLKQVDGCSYAEIGQVLGCPRSAVETLLFRARQGLARAHERLESDPGASCKMISATMAVVLDKEGTPIQELAVKMHVSACRSCYDELASMKQGLAGYAWLPMLPVGGQALSAALAGGTTGAGAAFGLGRVVSLLFIKGQASGLAALTVGAIATAGVAGAAAGVTPSPFEAAGVVQEVGTAVRNATVGGGSADDASSALKEIEADAQPPLAPIQTQPLASGGPLQPVAPATLPQANQLDPISALGGLPGLLETASEGALASLEPLLAFVGGTLGGALEDPLAVLARLLNDPGGTVDDLAKDATQALNQTTQNTTTTVDDTVDQTTDIVDGLLGENQLTGSLDETVDNTTDLVDTSVGGLTETVDETTGDLEETLDGLLGDDGLLGGDDGLLGGDDGLLGGDDGLLGGDDGLLGGDDGLLGGDDGLLGGGGSPPDSEEGEEPPPEEEEPPCVLGLLFCN